jgi:peptidylamidoglycolate lyase
MPDGTVLGQVGGMGVSGDGTVYVYHRGEKNWGGGGRLWSRIQNFVRRYMEAPDTTQSVQETAILGVHPETGALLSAIGADIFLIPHGLAVDGDDNLWLTDVGRHQVIKMSRNGDVLLVIGEKGVAGAGRGQFNKPTDVAVAPDGSFYVADGYGNARVVKFSSSGEYLFEWGGRGSAPGQFDTPHGIAIDAEQNIYVADRGNARLQVFDRKGVYLREFSGPEIGRPWAVDVAADGRIFVADGGDQVPDDDRSGLVVLAPDGTLVARWSQFGYGPGELVWPHDLAVSITSEVFVGEVLDSHRVQKFTTDCAE